MAVRGERYETLRVIASGGMATVHLGRALGAGGFERLVAIKVMHPHLAGEPEFVAMFLDEARLAARIRHPNVVSTLDVQSDSEGVFLVMDYVEGPSLQQIFRALSKAAGQMPLDILFRIFLDALAGLHAAHELCDSAGKPLNLVHRDVSPQNILIGSDGIARITDFGVALAEARLSSTHGGQLKGKLGYMSPEQARSEPVDRRTDIYAAGVMLWEALAGGRRFRVGSEASVIAAIGQGEARSLREDNPSVPAPLEACCMRALAANAAERHPTAADFADALENAVAASELQIASTRAVAAFVTGLGAHERPVDLPAAPPPSRASMILPVGPPPSRRSLHSAPAIATQASLPGTVPGVRPSVAEPSPMSMSPAPFPGEVSTHVTPPQRGASRRVSLLLGAAAAVTVFLAAVVIQRRSSAENGVASPQASQARAPTGDTAHSSLPLVAPPATSASAAPSATAAASAAAASAAIASPSPPAPSASASVKSPAVKPTAPRDPPKPPDQPPSTSPVYRPPDL